MALLGREQILNADDRSFEDVPVPQWGGEVRIRSLSANERNKFERSQFRINKQGNPVPADGNPMAKLVAMSAIDGNGDPLFFGDKDERLLGTKNSAALTVLFEAACRISRITDEDLDEMVGDFSSDQSDSSTSN